MNGKGFEPLYLRPGMNEAELFAAFNARNGYYRYIAERLVGHVRRFQGQNFGTVMDVLARTGYLARAVGETKRTFAVEHRPAFVDYLRTEFVADRHVRIVAEAPLDAAMRLKPHTVLCCEQISMLHGDYAELVKRLADGRDDVLFAFAFTLGPSHHAFTTLHLSDFRSGVVNPGEVMTELSHPIQQRVQQEVLRIVRERYNYMGEDVWPPKAKQFDLAAIRSANEGAGLRQLSLNEEVFPVPGHQVVNYSQNGWTSFFRHAPLAEFPTETKIAVLIEAIELVRALPEYPGWCETEAYHPVAYIVAS